VKTAPETSIYLGCFSPGLEQGRIKGVKENGKKEYGIGNISNVLDEQKRTILILYC